ncbi:hypothetical protein BZA77DRAFT_134586 [Pyronema omphalodes]|nr:hypothetical protein BZA77DRAFT_134586 [Pyronema omphalodes]
MKEGDCDQLTEEPPASLSNPQTHTQTQTQTQTPTTHCGAEDEKNDDKPEEDPEPSTISLTATNVTIPKSAGTKYPAAPDPNHPPSVLPIIAQDVANKSIAYLSTASPEQLIAVSIGGAVVLYFFLGDLGLLFVGIVVGVVGHAAVTLSQPTDAAELWLEGKKKEVAKEEESAVVIKVRHFGSSQVYW